MQDVNGCMGRLTVILMCVCASKVGIAPNIFGEGVPLGDVALFSNVLDLGSVNKMMKI